PYLPRFVNENSLNPFRLRIPPPVCCYYSHFQAKNAVQAADIGIASARAGSILTTGNILIPQIRKPVATNSNPPTALKSPIIPGVVNGNIKAAQAASVSCTASNGTAIAETAIPNEQAKISAVKKSRNDLAIKMLGSPVIPSFIAPKIPVPLAQNNTIIAT